MKLAPEGNPSKLQSHHPFVEVFYAYFRQFFHHNDHMIKSEGTVKLSRNAKIERDITEDVLTKFSGKKLSDIVVNLSRNTVCS